MYGIYTIKNKKENKYYISSSMFVDHRIYHHKKMLMEKAHPNKDLQADYNRLGKENFEFEIIYDQLEEIDVPVKENDLIEKLEKSNNISIYKKKNNEDQKNVKIDFDIHHQLKLISTKTGISMAKLIEIGSLKVINDFKDGEFDKLVNIKNNIRRDGTISH